MNSNIKSLHQQAQSALNQGEYKLAHQCLLSILQQDKYFADAYFLLAMIASAHQNFAKAIELIKQADVLAPNNAEYLAQLAKHYALENNHVLAVAIAEKTACLPSISALTFDTLGVAYSQIGLHEKSVGLFKQAIALDKSKAMYFFNLGASLKFIGDFAGARAAYEKTIELAPTYCKAHAALSSLGGISEQKNNIERLTSLFEQSINIDDKLYIGHALAREYEALKNYSQAFEYLMAAKQAKVETLEYSINDDKAMFACLQKTFQENPLKINEGFDSTEALFVVGMPRTGTTLVERILSQHSEVTSAGELQHFGLLVKKMSGTSTNRVIDVDTILAAQSIDYKKLGQAYIDSTRAITGKTAKFVDKMPLNVLYVGFILQALPKAKIVCLDRNPLDTIMSNFRQLFAVNFSYYNYSYALNSTTEFYLLFKSLAEFWLKQYSENFYLVDYEKLVNNPEVEARKLVEFCDLTWQAQCLEIDKNNAPVATASAVQVRSPISAKNIGNWKKYQAFLQPVHKILE